MQIPCDGRNSLNRRTDVGADKFLDKKQAKSVCRKHTKCCKVFSKTGKSAHENGRFHNYTREFCKLHTCKWAFSLVEMDSF